ncbi:MAG: hypothetical protein K6348_05205 [Deferribacterales bacterium]
MFFSKGSLKLRWYKIYDALVEGKYDDAIDLLKEEFSGKEIPEEFYFLMGKLLNKNGEFENSLQINQNLLASSKSKEEQYIFKKEIATSLLGLGRLESAKDLMLDILSSKDDIKLMEKVAEIYYKSGEYDFAAETYKRLNQYDMVAACYYRKAIKFNIKDGEFADLLQKGLKYNRSFRTARFELANHYFTLSKNGKGLDYLIEILYNELPFSLEDIYTIKDKFVLYSSVIDFEKIINKKINEGVTNPFYHIYLAEESYLNGNLNAAKDIIARYLSQHFSKNAIKFYLKYIADDLLSSLYAEEHLYQCTFCKTTYKTFIPVCPSCEHVDSLKAL